MRRVADGWSPEPRALIGPTIASGIGPPGAGMMGAISHVLPRSWRGTSRRIANAAHERH